MLLVPGVGIFFLSIFKYKGHNSSTVNGQSRYGYQACWLAGVRNSISTARTSVNPDSVIILLVLKTYLVIDAAVTARRRFSGFVLRTIEELKACLSQREQREQEYT